MRFIALRKRYTRTYKQTMIMSTLGDSRVEGEGARVRKKAKARARAWEARYRIRVIEVMGRRVLFPLGVVARRC
jgi:hypothetical protein